MIITLTTDIGWEYAAEMKGKILSINPEAKIVDITHTIEPQNILQGAFVLYSVVPYFKNAIHVGVVDPGVGTERKGIIIKCSGNIYFVGPDNGLLIPAAERMGVKEIYEIKLKGDESPVFHGRDVFAPAAAKISKGTKISTLGKKMKEYVPLQFEEPLIMENAVRGKILFIDGFGNIITNVRGKDIKSKEFTVKIGMVEKKVRLLPSYGHGEKNEIMAIIGSSGFMEIARREENASRYFNAREGMAIEIFF